MTTIDGLVCAECGQPLVNAINYATCPELHGHLKPKLSAAEERLAKVSRLPWMDREVKGTTSYTVNGRPVRLLNRFGSKRAAKLIEHGTKNVARLRWCSLTFGAFEIIKHPANK